MKTFFSLILTVVMLSSCSPDSDSGTDKSDFANLTGSPLYPKFSTLLDKLYGHDTYSLDRAVTRTEGGEQYEITPVIDAHTQIVLGYYEENRGDLVYYHHEAAAKPSRCIH